ncbi:MAG TPA: PAS domain S-box protein [Planctomycetota bacterium]|nr:PAS domain S-box protein [Planctomycetota bacterium]
MKVSFSDLRKIANWKLLRPAAIVVFALLAAILTLYFILRSFENAQLHASQALLIAGLIVTLAFGAMTFELARRRQALHRLAQLKNEADEAAIASEARYRTLFESIAQRKQVQDELERSEERFRKVVEDGPLGIGLRDLNGNFFFASKRLCEMSGRTEEDFRVKGLKETSLPEDFSIDQACSARLLKGEIEHYTFEKRLLRKDGTHLWVQKTVSLMCANDGSPLYFIAMLHDIDARKKAELELERRRESLENAIVERTAELQLKNAQLASEVVERTQSEEKLRTLSQAVENSATMVVITDSKGLIEYVNPTFVQTTGYTRDEVVGKSPKVLSSKTHAASFYENMWNTILSGNKWRGEFLNKRKNGELYWQAAAIAPIYNAKGVITHFVSVMEDITERKRLDEELKNAKETAEAANRAKSAFLAVMSHEIRTPMNAILGMNYLLRHSQLTPKQGEYTARIDTAARNLLAIINDILDFSKVEAGRIELESIEFNLEDVLNNLVHISTLQAQQKGLELKLIIAPEVPCALVGDSLRLGQVLLNLVNNAVKFTRKGEVEITVAREASSDPALAALNFSVRDTGIGIAREQLAYIFEPFGQADTSTARHYGGTGLGLAICKRFVQLMGGDIKVDSEEGVGSHFSFTLPFKISAFQNNPRSIPRAKSVQLKQIDHSILRGARILLVEDNEVNQQVAVEILTMAGCDVTAAPDGAAALAILSNAGNDHAFACVLMDLQMPGMDGYAATRAIRAQERFASLPVLAMTADAISGVRESCIKAGMNDYLSKPIRPDKLFATLARWVAHARSGVPPNARPAHESAQDWTVSPVPTPYPAPRDEPPAVDFKTPLKQMDNNHALFARLLQQFQQKYANADKEIAEAIARGNRKDALAQLHSLKGVSATLGFNAVSRAARHWEAELKSDAPESNGACAQIQESLREAMACIAVKLDGDR